MPRQGNAKNAEQQQAQGQSVTVDTSLPTFTWTIEVTFEKYQFSEAFQSYISENFVPIKSEPEEVTITYIRERYGG